MTPQTHNGLEDQDFPTNLQREPTAVAEAVAEEEEAVEEEDPQQQRGIQTMAPS